MAFFGLFGKKTGEGAVRKHAERVVKRHAQSPDRWESIQALAAMGTPEALEALLGRFTIYVDPSISDQEEKEAAFDGVVAAGALAIEPVRNFMRRAESLSWPIRILDKLLEPVEVVSEIIGLLATMDTEYERDPQRKLQLLAELEERRDPRIVDAARRFLEDVNETARFHAVSAIYAQPEAETARADITKALATEESVRVRVRILEGLAERGWDVGPAREKIASVLPAGFTLDKDGIPKKKSK